MGEHHSQCFATRQTISPGHKCYALAIRQMATYRPSAMQHKGREYEVSGIARTNIYPNNFWTPVGNFIEGKYRLNGDINPTENDENFRRLLVFVKLMLKNAPVVAQGENPAHDHPYDIATFIKENCPDLQKYLDGELTRSCSKVDKAKVFEDLVSAWTHTDDVAFKHRVFYADHSGTPRPLQFTLMHGKCYDHLLSQVSAEYSPEALFEKVLADLESHRESAAPLISKLAKNPDYYEMLTWLGPRAFESTLRQLGEFDDIEYNEELLGFGDFGIEYLQGKVKKDQLQKLALPVLSDRLVIRMLEEYEIKFSPKSYRYADSRNDIGKSYADLVSQVSAAVTKSRPRTK